MNKETYEALKNIIKERRPNVYPNTPYGVELEEDFKRVENWINEVAKEINNDETMKELTGYTDEEFSKKED